MWMIRHKVSRLRAAEEVPEARLIEARAEHRVYWQSYEAQRELFQAQATNPGLFARPSDLEAQFKQQVEGFVPVVGHALGLRHEPWAGAYSLRAVVASGP